MRERGYYWCRAKKRDEWDNDDWAIYFWDGESDWYQFGDSTVFGDDDMLEINEERILQPKSNDTEKAPD